MFSEMVSNEYWQSFSDTISYRSQICFQHVARLKDSELKAYGQNNSAAD